MEAKINALLADEAFAAKVEAAEDLEAIVELFKAEGVEATAEQIAAGLEQVSGELDENALEDVAGGCAGVAIIGGLRIAKWLYDLLRKRYGNQWRSHVGSSGIGHGGGGHHF